MFQNKLCDILRKTKVSFVIVAMHNLGTTWAQLGLTEILVFLFEILVFFRD